MNDLALELGYSGHTEYKSLEERNKERAVNNIEIARESIINKLGGSDKKQKANITKTVDKFISKYGHELLEGKYSLISVDTLVVIGLGSIVDEENGVIVWTGEQYLKWEDMTEL